MGHNKGGLDVAFHLEVSSNIKISFHLQIILDKDLLRGKIPFNDIIDGQGVFSFLQEQGVFGTADDNIAVTRFCGGRVIGNDGSGIGIDPYDNPVGTVS